MLNSKMPNLFRSQVSLWGKVITGYLLLLDQFCSFLIQTLESPKLQQGNASLHALLLNAKGSPLYGLCSRVIYWNATSSFGIWGKMVCLAVLLSVSCCLLSAFLSTPSRCLPFHTPLCLWKFFQFLSLSLNLQFSFFLCVSKSPYHQYITSLSLRVLPGS